AEQATAAEQISATAESMRKQSDQVSRAMNEQARAIKEMTGAARDVAKQIGLIARSNREHMGFSANIIASLADTQRITERNGQGRREALGPTTGLLERAGTLNAIVEAVAGTVNQNGPRGKKSAKKKSKK